MHRRLVITLAAGCIAGLAACAGAPGPVFSGLAVPPTAHGVLHVYRTDVWFTPATAVPVKVGLVQEGLLPNAAYLPIALPPGWHVVEVNGVTTRVAVLGGHNHFLLLDLSDSAIDLGALANQRATADTERGVLRLRDASLGAHELRGLRRVAGR